MPRTVRWTSAVFGSMKVSESDSALATITDFSSGVRYRWCGCLPVSMRLISVQFAGLITLTLSSRELSTNTGVVMTAVAGAAAGTPAVCPEADRHSKAEKAAMQTAGKRE